MRSLLTAVVVFYFFISAYSQNTDSLSYSKDSPGNVLQQANDKLQEVQDSLTHLKLQRVIEQHGKPLGQFLAERKEQERREKRQLYIRIGFGIAILLVLIIGIVRQWKRKQNLR